MSRALRDTTISERRPKRIPSRNRKDDILGLSWREEQDLRRAMYASLKRCRENYRFKKASRFSKRLLPAVNRKAAPKRLPSIKQPALVPQHRMKNLTSSIGRPKLQKATSSDAFLVKRKSCKNKPTQATSTINLRPTASRRAFAYSMKRNQPSIKAPQRRELAKRNLQQALGENLHNKKCASIRKPPSSPRQRSPIRRATTLGSKNTPTLAANPNNSEEDDERVNIPSAQASCKLKLRTPCGAAKSETTLIKQTALTDVPCQSVVNTPEKVDTSRNLTSPNTDNVPAQLWQDVSGRPVDTHDFVDFLCYYGTPCLSKRLAWFSLPPSLRDSSSRLLTQPSAKSTANLDMAGTCNRSAFMPSCLKRSNCGLLASPTNRAALPVARKTVANSLSPKTTTAFIKERLVNSLTSTPVKGIKKRRYMRSNIVACETKE